LRVGVKVIMFIPECIRLWFTSVHPMKIKSDTGASL